MCASYGLQVKPEDIHYGFSIVDDRASRADLERWLDEFRDEPAKPTGVHRRNLNPIVRERVKDGEHRRTVDLAWWKLWCAASRPSSPRSTRVSRGSRPREHGGRRSRRAGRSCPRPSTSR